MSASGADGHVEAKPPRVRFGGKADFGPGTGSAHKPNSAIGG